MAAPTPHQALEGLGFHLAGQWNTKNGATVNHYMKRGSVGYGTPVNHHVSVAEWPQKPGMYNTYYQVMHDNAEPFDDRAYDIVHRHVENEREPGEGVADPIREVGQWHRAVVNHLRQLPAPRLQAITPQNMNVLHRQPPMVHLNAVSGSLDPYVHHVLTGGDNPEFDYLGEDDGTHVYHVRYQDPQDPEGMAYGFTVRHMPSAQPEPDDLAGKPILDEFGDDTGGNHLPLKKQRARQFSYNVTHFPTDMGTEDGDYPVGEFLDVVGTGHPEEGGSPVATFTNPDAVLDRHHSMMRSLGLMPKLPQPENENRGQFAKRSMDKFADEFDDIIKGNGYDGTCELCGKAVRDIPESSFREDKKYEVYPEDEAPDMHGRPVTVCGECSQNPISTEAFKPQAARKNFGWHWNDEGVPGCPQCEAHLMDQADEDLRP